MAVHFADLHDTPGRMKAKGVIRRQVQWAESRTFFYWRLKRRLLEFDLVNSCGNQSNVGERKHAIARLKQWYLSQGGDDVAWEDDRLMVDWFEDHETETKAYIAEALGRACVEEIGAKLSALVRTTSGKGAHSGDILKQALQLLPESERAQILSAFK